MSTFLLLGVGFALGLFYGVFAGAALAYGLTHCPPRAQHCGQCGAELQAMRPGKYQCLECE